MLKRSRCSIAAAIVLAVGVALVAKPDAQTPTYQAPRTFDGKPDLNGIWQALGEAHWDLQAHPAQQGPVQFGAMFSVPPGIGVVEGNQIPYLPAAAEKKKQNYEKRLTDDPERKCYLPGMPRATYMPYPFQIVQTPSNILMAYEYAGARRVIPIGKPIKEPPVDTWMGTPFGRWEGETLVVDVTGFNGQTWLDRAGNFASETLHVVERFTRTGPDTLRYEAALEDPNVFSRPWTISMPLYRRLDRNMQLLEFKCPEFAEELLWGHLQKKTK
jgi:hypothetical protein